MKGIVEILAFIVLFWNVENYYDPFANSPKDGDSTSFADLDFTPAGGKYWSWKKFEKKRDDITRTIYLVTEKYGIPPAIIGLAEIENRFVLNQLVENTILAPLDYGIIHRDSPDRRGIDVALLYRKGEFKPIAVHFYPIAGIHTREMLYVKGIFRELDTLHCIVVHWPSKIGDNSARTRMSASMRLKGVTDSILQTNCRANIIVTGDFNDTHSSNPLRNLYDGDGSLISLTALRDFKKNRGTYKYKESWEVIDHFLISKGLFREKDKEVFPAQWLHCYNHSFEIFSHPYLLERDRVYLGYKLRRTLIGPRYNGGISDHLPIVLKVYGYQ